VGQREEGGGAVKAVTGGKVTSDRWVGTEKPLLVQNRGRREALNAFLAVHSRFMDRETRELRGENEGLRAKLQALREREAMKLR
jgi:hypothetical protein